MPESPKCVHPPQNYGQIMIIMIIIITNMMYIMNNKCLNHQGVCTRRKIIIKATLPFLCISCKLFCVYWTLIPCNAVEIDKYKRS